MKDLQQRIIDISYKLKLSHIGSNLTALPILEEIYEDRKPGDKVILSSGHAHLAHLVVQGFSKDRIEEKVNAFGIHCDRKAGCDVSTGSLGHGIGIALGMALADRTQNVYCLISDGECSEGSVWEALRVKKEQKVDNLLVYANLNGWGAYKAIVKESGLAEELLRYNVNISYTNCDAFSFLQGQQAHYHIMSEEDYTKAKEVLSEN